MIFLQRPKSAALERVLERSHTLSYPEVGATHPDTANVAAQLRGSPDFLRGYLTDHHYTYIGHGDALFTRGAQALRDWQMYRLPWLSLYPALPALVPGTRAGALARHFGFYSFNPFATVYTLGRPGRVAFAVGTLPGHAVAGEERFMLEQRPDGSVWFDLLAFSKPAHWLTRAAYPVARQQQKRFAPGAYRALQKAVSS